MILQRNIFRVVSSVKALKTPSIVKTIPHCYCVLRNSSDNAGRRFTDRHEWITVEKDVGVVGITQYAQEALGDVVFAQLPEPSTQIKIGDECGALESVKAASEIYTPVSGTVVEKNKSVEEKPGLINSSCYEKGWLFKLKISNPEELEKLMNEKQYEEFLKSDHQEHGH